jgi:hypothetical protein
MYASSSAKRQDNGLLPGLHKHNKHSHTWLYVGMLCHCRTLYVCTYAWLYIAMFHTTNNHTYKHTYKYIRSESCFDAANKKKQYTCTHNLYQRPSHYMRLSYSKTFHKHIGANRDTTPNGPTLEIQRKNVFDDAQVCVYVARRGAAQQTWLEAPSFAFQLSSLHMYRDVHTHTLKHRHSSCTHMFTYTYVYINTHVPNERWWYRRMHTYDNTHKQGIQKK